jgi:hypothetical protein
VKLRGQKDKQKAGQKFDMSLGDLLIDFKLLAKPKISSSARAAGQPIYLAGGGSAHYAGSAVDVSLAGPSWESMDKWIDEYIYINEDSHEDINQTFNPAHVVAYAANQLAAYQTWALLGLPDPEPPACAPIGPRSRRSPLAERVSA